MSAWAIAKLGTPLGVTCGLVVFATVLVIAKVLWAGAAPSRQAVLDHLGRFRDAGVELRNQHVADDGDFSSWQSLVGEWRANLEAALTHYFGSHKANLLLVLDHYQPIQIGLPPPYGERYGGKRADLSERLRRLQQLMEDVESGTVRILRHR